MTTLLETKEEDHLEKREDMKRRDEERAIGG